MKEKPECHLCEQKILYLEPGMRHTECRLGYSLTEGKCVKTKDVKTNDMEKTIEIPEGHEARIEGNKVILERKESEDERIRKEIKDFLTDGIWNATIIDKVKQSQRYAKWIAYLERQKESHFTKRNALFDKCVEDCDPAVMKEVSDSIDKMLEKEQKPAEDKDAIKPTPKQDYSGLTDFERAIHRGFLCAGVENVPVDIIKDTAQDCLAHIKPAEWSEKDEKNRHPLNTKEIKVGDIITYFRNGKKGIMLVSSFDSGIYPRCKWGITDIDGTAYGDWAPGFGPYYTATEKEKQQLYDTMPIEVKDWLKALRTQPKQEWSEEDEAAFGDLMWCIEQARKSAKDENDMGNIWFAETWVKNRIKSLRPSWKPSEEQMAVLKNAVHFYGTTVGRKVLKSLCNDLEKL